MKSPPPYTENHILRRFNGDLALASAYPFHTTTADKKPRCVNARLYATTRSVGAPGPLVHAPSVATS